MDQASILEMAQGAIMEQIDIEVKKIVDNILDVNTNPTKKRTLSVNIQFIPSADRTKVSIKALAKSKLEPNNAIETALQIGLTANGAVAQEMTAYIPGQLNVNGEVQENPKILKMNTKENLA